MSDLKIKLPLLCSNVRLENQIATCQHRHLQSLQLTYAKVSLCYFYNVFFYFKFKTN